MTGYRDLYYEWTQLEAAALGIQFVLSLPYTYAMFSSDFNQVTNSLFLQIWNAFDLCIAMYFAINFIYRDPAPLNIAYKALTAARSFGFFYLVYEKYVTEYV